MYEKILIATDGSEPSQKAEDHGLQLAHELGASVTVLYVAEITYAPQPIPGSPPILLEEQTEKLKEAGQKIVNSVKETGKDKGVQVTPVVMVGHPANEIINHAKTHDLVVVGTLGGSGITHLLMGSVAEKVVRHAPVPVLVVRYKK
ncbi:MAG: universal stress protein [Candidatus Methanofastidiosia archaeon]|jgi:nucleotide-binding universal stress UspA family protein